MFWKPDTVNMHFSYNDVILYPSDLVRFKDGHWLNDQCINFCFKWFENEEFKAFPSLLFFDPAVVSCLRLQCQDDDEYAELSDGLNLSTKSLLFVPVNDNDSFQSNSSHWSLLICFTRTGQLFHIDSCKNYNRNAAYSTAIAIYKLLKRL